MLCGNYERGVNNYKGKVTMQIITLKIFTSTHFHGNLHKNKLWISKYTWKIDLKNASIFTRLPLRVHDLMTMQLTQLLKNRNGSICIKYST